MTIRKRDDYKSTDLRDNIVRNLNELRKQTIVLYNVQTQIDVLTMKFTELLEENVQKSLISDTEKLANKLKQQFGNMDNIDMVIDYIENFNDE